MSSTSGQTLKGLKPRRTTPDSAKCPIPFQNLFLMDIQAHVSDSEWSREGNWLSQSIWNFLGKTSVIMCIFSTPTTRQNLASFSADRVRFQRAFVPSIRTGGLRALLLRIKNEYPVTVSNSFRYQYQCCPHWCQAFKHKNRTNMSKHQQHLPVYIKTCLLIHSVFVGDAPTFWEGCRQETGW